jgi:hypothetical protein
MKSTKDIGLKIGRAFVEETKRGFKSLNNYTVIKHSCEEDTAVFAFGSFSHLRINSLSSLKLFIRCKGFLAYPSVSLEYVQYLRLCFNIEYILNK